QNLVGNAVKYHHQQTGHIHLGHSRNGENWEFWVQDDGPGIAPEYLQKIFNIFLTLRPKDDIDGTGVGLAIVKKTFEESGGKIWVESSPGAGSVFRFSIPAEKVMEATSVMP
ncbi:MAG: ATP-binding protein, partial [Salibacteraceae bacterium]